MIVKDADRARTFCQVGDGSYQLTLEHLGIQFTVDRLRRDRHELLGELAVRCTLPGARPMYADFLSVAGFNLSSAQARLTRAKLLAQRSAAPDVDWEARLEELCIRIIAAERDGSPAKPLTTFPRPDSDDVVLNVDGWMWLRDHPMITFADGGSLKSYLLLHGAGVLSQRGLKVGYVDWELTGSEHHERLGRLFAAPVPEIHYFRCDRPLVDEADRIGREVHRLGLEYLVFDSAGFGTAGPPEAAEHALGYFRAVRQFGVGSHHLAHVNRSDNGDQKPFGSSFWHNSARATWYAKLAGASADGQQLTVGLFNRKSNLTRLYPAVGFQFDFSEAGVTTVTRVDLADVEDLAATLPLWQRIAHFLRSGSGFPRTVAEIAEALDVKPDSVKHAVSPSRLRKGGSMFTQVPGSDGKPRIALVDRRPA